VYRTAGPLTTGLGRVSSAPDPSGGVGSWGSWMARSNTLFVAVPTYGNKSGRGTLAADEPRLLVLVSAPLVATVCLVFNECCYRWIGAPGSVTDRLANPMPPDPGVVGPVRDHGC